jgi:hypothetical protein
MGGWLPDAFAVAGFLKKFNNEEHQGHQEERTKKNYRLRRCWAGGFSSWWSWYAWWLNLLVPEGTAIIVAWMKSRDLSRQTPGFHPGYR